MRQIRGRRHWHPVVLVSLSFLIPMLSSGRCYTTGIVLLQDLPTPSFVIDLQAVQKVLGRPEAPIPPIALPSASRCLVPRRRVPFEEHQDDTFAPPPKSLHIFDPNLKPLALFVNDDTDRTTSSNAAGDVCYGYIHTRVVRSRSDTTRTQPLLQPDDDDPASQQGFLAQLDAPNVAAHLVLGLNNHHVVSYYWARSAGAGAAMEAPGIVFQGGTLQWESDAGCFTDCNSNDGKRSEWVNFLRVGDTVQLRPHHPEEALLVSSCGAMGIYGVSSAGRPLGSEPMVVCEWEMLPLPISPTVRSDVIHK